MATGLTAALHLLALFLFLFRPHQDDPQASVPPSRLTISIERELDLRRPPPPEPLPPTEPLEAKRSSRAESSPLPARPAPPAGPPAPSFDAVAAPFVWKPAPSATPDGGLGSGDGVGEGAGGGGGDGAEGQRGGSGSLSMEGPQWIRRPTEAEMIKAIPLEALNHQTGGSVVLACLVRPDNRAHRCKVLSESPAELGFGLAAQRLSRVFLIRPPLRGGEPRYDVPVRIPIVWEKM